MNILNFDRYHFTADWPGGKERYPIVELANQKQKRAFIFHMQCAIKDAVLSGLVTLTFPS